MPKRLVLFRILRPSQSIYGFECQFRTRCARTDVIYSLLNTPEAIHDGKTNFRSHVSRKAAESPSSLFDDEAYKSKEEGQQVCMKTQSTTCRMQVNTP